jgi:hypothetical protein
MLRHCLQIYVSGHCLGCDDAALIAAEITETFPDVDVQVIDMHTPGIAVPPEVFASPTYLWNGKRYSLGNPRRADLRAMIAANIRGESAPW